MRMLPLLLLASCTTVESIHDEYVSERAKLDPQWASGIGIHDYDDQLTKHDDASVAARRALVERTLEKLRNYDSVDARLFRSQLEVEAYNYAKDDYRKTYLLAPVDAVSSAQDLLLKDFSPLEVRQRNAEARLRQLPELIDEIRKHIGRPPKIWTEMAIEIVKDIPELESYLAFLRNVVLPRSDGNFAVGKETYDFYLKHGLLLSMDSDELLAIGKREFAATLTMLEDLDPNWRDTLKEMLKEYPKLEEVLDVYRKEVARARQFLIDKNVVGIPSWEKLEVIPTPVTEQASTPTAAYHAPGPLDAARTGHFYVTLSEESLPAHNIYDIPGTVWHEAYPGHHLQFVYAKEVTSKIRRLNDSPLLSEGWGFYCEELAHELGYYRNKKERLMQLNWRLQRGARVILDVSLHTGAMTYEDAVKFLVEQVGMDEDQARPSVYNYTMSPTYYVSYMIGMLEIVRMRAKFGWPLREFHERLLRFGNVPPSIIEAELEKR